MNFISYLQYQLAHQSSQKNPINSLSILQKFEWLSNKLESIEVFL